jgi:SAM-dependent methyltransferase
VPDPVAQPVLYDSIGTGYAERRQPDPRISEALRSALGDARRIVNVGAGAGSYEPVEITAAAVEPSAVMAAQRPPPLVPAVLSSAEQLPFVDEAFDGALAVLTIHHWGDAARGLRELRRVTAGPIVILTFDPEVFSSWWLPAEYAPELRPLAFEDAPELDLLRSELSCARITVLPVPARCRDGFLMAFWDRPELVLDPSARAATSGFARLSDLVQQRICERLSADLRSGRWDERYGYLRELSEFDSGLRLVVAPGAHAAD